MAAPIPKWGKEVKKCLIDRDLTIGEFADQIGASRIFVSNVIHGNQMSADMVSKISRELDIPEMGMCDVLR